MKFRAWLNGKMWPCSVLNNCGHAGEVEDLDFQAMGASVALLPAGTPIVQSTGLKDKNDDLIFEGDILSFPFSTKASGWDVEYEGKKMQVIERAGAFWTKPVDFNDSRFEGLLMHAVGMEITGNIYANPELIQS